MKSKGSPSAQARDTGLAMVLLLLLGWFFLRKENLVLAAMAVLVLTMTWPMAFRPLSRLWFGFSFLLGAVVSRMILSLIFFCIATPVGLIRRLGGADAMRLKDWRNGADSAFVDRSQTFMAGDLEKPY